MPRVTCRGCRQPIRWAHTYPGGQPVALDPRPDPAGSLTFVVTDRGWRVRDVRPGDTDPAGGRWQPHARACPALRAAVS
jgi:hypothetical protein